jgi:hypothetical protein
MPGSRDEARDGAGVKHLEPGGIEEHDFRDVPRASRDDDVLPKGNDSTRDCDIAKSVLRGTLDDFSHVVEKDESFEEFPRAQLQCGLENVRKPVGCEVGIVVEVDEFALQNVETETDGHAIEVVHDAGYIVGGYDDGDACVGEVQGERCSRGHRYFFRLVRRSRAGRVRICYGWV